MRIITINGESKVCKTTVGEKVAAHLGGQTADAGQFFRGFTVDTLAALGTETIVPVSAKLDAAAQQVIVSGQAFELRDRGNLYRPVIEGMVTVVSSRPGVQQAGLEWYGRTVDNALATGVGALVLNGRNPNDRMHDTLVRNAQAVDLSLLVDCNPMVAAERVLLAKAKAKGMADPTGAEIKAAAESIVARRELDRKRDDFPFEWPGQMVAYEPGESDPHDTVARALELGSAVAPAEIYFDTTYMDMGSMTEHANLLADAAMEQATVKQFDNFTNPVA